MNLRVFLFLLFCFPTSDSVAQLDQSKIQFVDDVLFRSEYKSRPDQFCKMWVRAPMLSVFGTGNLHENVVSSVVKQLNSCLPVDRQIEILPNSSPNATFKIYFAPKEKLGQIAEDNEFTFVDENLGFFYSYWNSNHEIQRSVVLIAEDRLSGYRLHHYVLEEITQALGFPGDTTLDPKSVFYEIQEQQKYGNATRLGLTDQELIRFHYSFNKPGETQMKVGLNLAKYLMSKGKQK